MAIADHSCAAAVEADNAVRPAELTNDFIALRLVEQGRQLDQVHHGSRSLPHRERPTDQLPDQDQHPEILPRAGGSLPARSPSPRNPTRALWIALRTGYIVTVTVRRGPFHATQPHRR